MEPIISRCGYRCDLCLAYATNVAKNPANKERLSDGWHKYFGFRLPPAEICCNGCLAEHSSLIDQSCPVRPCAMEKGLDNCSQCSQYICEKLKERLVVYEEVQRRVGTAIPEEDRVAFICPYENKARLEALRAAQDDQQTGGS